MTGLLLVASFSSLGRHCRPSLERAACLLLASDQRMAILDDLGALLELVLKEGGALHQAPHAFGLLRVQGVPEVGLLGACLGGFLQQLLVPVFGQPLFPLLPIGRLFGIAFRLFCFTLGLTLQPLLFKHLFLPASPLLLQLALPFVKFGLHLQPARGGLGRLVLGTPKPLLLFNLGLQQLPPPLQLFGLELCLPPSPTVVLQRPLALPFPPFLFLRLLTPPSQLALLFLGFELTSSPLQLVFLLHHLRPSECVVRTS